MRIIEISRPYKICIDRCRALRFETMEIQHDEGKKGTFYIEQDGERLGELQYFHPNSNEINIFHTEVSDKLAGQGMGKKLVGAAVEYAREKGLKIEATCPFAHKVIEKTPEFQDVLADSV